MFSAVSFPNTLTPACTSTPSASINKMDPSLSVKKDKDKGKSKKNKKDKKGKTKKEKQPVSIDLTSPARARAHTPADPDAAQTPTRVPSQQSGKRGRSTTRREGLQPAASKNDHTYNSKPLPLFSSNNPTGPPSAGPPSTGRDAVRPRAKSATAIATPNRTNDIERSSYNHDCKIKTLETCLSLKDRYFAMPPAVQTDQEPFWARVRDFLERRSITRGKFKDWQAVQRAVESWCQPRRSSMREERLPAVSQSHLELDELVDEWNLVFAQRFCKIHMGYFSNAIWPQFVEAKLTEMVESNLNARIADILTKRYEALQGPNPSTLLPSNSSLTDCGNTLKAIQSTAAQTNEDQVRKSEAVMSMVLELQPGLRTALSQFLSGPNAPTRTEPTRGLQKENGNPASREPVNSTILPSRAAPPALQRPVSSLGLGQQGPTPRGTPPFLSLPARPSENSWEESSRKRKDLDLPTRSHARTNSRGSGASFKDDNKPKASSHDQAKRPRYESHFSDLPSATNFALSGRDNHGRRTPSSQRSRRQSPQRPKTSYGPIETQVHRSRGNDRMPTMTPCPTGPGPTTESRTDVPRRPTGSQIPGDYYRPASMSRRSN